MSEETVQTLLEKDHREIDALFERAVAGDGAALAEFKERLGLHMQIEEEIVFRALAGGPLTIPARVMTSEHDRLRQLLRATEVDFEEIAACLGPHNLKEENVIYPSCNAPAFASMTAAVAKALQRPLPPR